MDDTYPEKVREALLPLSEATTMREAILEWEFSGETVDHETAEETCQLCGQEQLRYHFEIVNGSTGHTLWVGSQCILKFGVAVVEGGQVLSRVRAKKKLDSLVAKMRRESCIRALERLAEAENTDILTNALKFYTNRGYLTPKFAFVVFWRLRQNGIDHHPTFFKVSLKLGKYMEDLRQMETSRVHVFWDALTAGQKAIAKRLGHEPPGA